jgi:hypothetical protein
MQRSKRTSKETIYMGRVALGLTVGDLADVGMVNELNMERNFSGSYFELIIL